MINNKLTQYCWKCLPCEILFIYTYKVNGRKAFVYYLTIKLGFLHVLGIKDISEEGRNASNVYLLTTRDSQQTE